MATLPFKKRKQESHWASASMAKPEHGCDVAASEKTALDDPAQTRRTTALPGGSRVKRKAVFTHEPIPAGNSCEGQAYQDGALAAEDGMGFRMRGPLSNRAGAIGAAAAGQWRPFTSARESVRQLCLKDQKAWRDWCRRGLRPADVPSHPDKAYNGNGWVSWRDWLGTQCGQPPRATKQHWKPFEEARRFVQQRELKNQKDWRNWSSESRPADIPSHPDKAYQGQGWLGWADFFGVAKNGDKI